jgi:hypothetical protein
VTGIAHITPIALDIDAQVQCDVAQAVLCCPALLVETSAAYWQYEALCTLLGSRVYPINPSAAAIHPHML